MVSWKLSAIAAEDKSKPQESLDPPSTEEAQVNSGPESPTANCSEHEAPTHVEELERRRCPEDVDMDDNVDTSGLKQRFLKCTEGYGIPQLERLYTRILKGVFEAKSAAGSDNPKSKVLQFLTNFPQDDTNF